MRQQKTLALAWALQAHTKESGFPTGVFCDVAWELQHCMAPMLVLNGDEIVQASLPEEEAILLGDIKADIKLDIKPPHIPEWLEIQEQVQPAEWTTTPTASLQFPPTHTSPLPSQKAKKSRERTTGADAIMPPCGSKPT